MSDHADLSSFTDAEVRAELVRRAAAANEAHWERAKANAKYLCPFCGGPDGWHNQGCASDALDTCT